MEYFASCTTCKLSFVVHGQLQGELARLLTDKLPCPKCPGEVKWILSRPSSYLTIEAERFYRVITGAESLAIPMPETIDALLLQSRIVAIRRNGKYISSLVLENGMELKLACSPYGVWVPYLEKVKCLV